VRRWLLAAAALVVSGCASALSRWEGERCLAELTTTFGQSAERLCACAGRDCYQPVVIVDFVTVDSYQPQHLGRRLAEEFRLAWQQHCATPVRVIELGSHYRLDEAGLKLLTRDVAALLNDTTADPVALIGTYRVERDRVRYFVRRVQLPTQTATAMHGGAISRHCLEPREGLPTTLLD